MSANRRATVFAHVIAAIVFAVACAGAGAEGANAQGRRIERVLLTESWELGYGGMMVLKYRPVVLYGICLTSTTYDPTGAVAQRYELSKESFEYRQLERYRRGAGRSGG